MNERTLWNVIRGDAFLGAQGSDRMIAMNYEIYEIEDGVWSFTADNVASSETFESEEEALAAVKRLDRGNAGPGSDHRDRSREASGGA